MSEKQEEPPVRGGFRFGFPNKILQGKGTVSKLDAECKATHEYDIFNKTQQITSDFDKEVKKIINQKSR